MKNIIKTSCVFIAILLLMILAAPTIQAAPTQGTDGAGASSGRGVVDSSISSLIQTMKPGDMGSKDASKVEQIASRILSIITNIGMVVSVVMLAILGIKYMIGSAEERVDYKKDLVPYFVGAVVLFGILGFIKILMALGTSIGKM